MRSMRLLAVAVLAVVLALSSAQNAFAATELAYDDGTAESAASPLVGGLVAVRFSLPTGWSAAKLLTARYYIEFGPSIFRVHVYGSTWTTELCCTPPLDVTPSATGWFDVDLTAYNIVVSGDFHIAAEWLATGIPGIGADSSSFPAWRSYYKNPGGDWTGGWGINLMIRADVDQPAIGAPVGGFMEPVNKLAVLAPYLALFGLVATAVVVVAAPWKKPGN